jgi:hypothetical protein
MVKKIPRQPTSSKTKERTWLGAYLMGDAEALRRLEEGYECEQRAFEEENRHVEKNERSLDRESQPSLDPSLLVLIGEWGSAGAWRAYNRAAIEEGRKDRRCEVCGNRFVVTARTSYRRECSKKCRDAQRKRRERAKKTRKL